MQRLLMIRTLSVVLALVALFALPVEAAAPSPPPAMTSADLDAFFSGLMPYALARGDIAGGAVVVVRDGKIAFAKGYGYADVAKRQPVSADRTLFRDGSVSKLFTWTAVMQLVQAGKLNLDADVNQYIDFKIPPKFGQPITLRNLMTHTAGFEEVIQDLLVEKPSQVLPLRQYMIEHMPNRIFPPGKVIAYSNYGASLAGYIVQRVSGEPFDEYIAKHILRPLRMEHSTFLQPLPASLVPLMSQGYTTASAADVTPFEYVVPAPAGAASATATDMAHFMLAYLDNGTYDGYSMLRPATIETMWTPQVALVPGLNGFDLGFYSEDRNGLRIVAHAGDTNVFHSDLHLIPAQHVGIFFAFNSAGKEGSAEDVRTNLFRRFLDRYYPFTAPREPAYRDAAQDAARVSGWYESSRRSESALRLVYAISQAGVSANADGTIQISSLLDPAQTPIKWREIGPLSYQQVDGQAHLKFATGYDGRLYFGTDYVVPVFVFQRVNGLVSYGSLKILIPCFLLVLAISLFVRLGAWIARRRLHVALDLTPAERSLHLAARIGALLFFAVLAGWFALVSNDRAILSPSVGSEMIVLYAFGVVTVLGGLAIVAESAMRFRPGHGGWLVRTGEAMVGLAAAYGIWLFVAFGLVSFVTRF